LLAGAGPEGLTMRRLAADLGVSYQVVYSRFGDKAGLLDALYRRGYDLLGARLTMVTTPVGSLERVTDMGLAYRDAALAEPALYLVMTSRPFPGYVPSSESVASARAAFQPIREAIAACFAAGLLAATDGVPDADTLAYLSWGTAHGLVSLELAGHDGPATGPDLVRAATAALLTPHLTDPSLGPHLAHATSTKASR
jgi:AcrR family transcriptional regulator